jgi:GT2 family glycosyltransferase
MIYVFIPQYNEDTQGFKESLTDQTVRYWEFRVDRKAQRIYWTGAANRFYYWILSDPAIQDTDIVCLLNNDISFSGNLFSVAKENMRHNRVLISIVYEDRLTDGGIKIDWLKKSFKVALSLRQIECFSTRGIFMTVKTFRESGGFNKHLPHYLADYEWSIRQIKRGVKPVRFGFVYHKFHNKQKYPLFSKLNPANPIYWTIFLWLCCPKKYLIQNILKSWFEVFR